MRKFQNEVIPNPHAVACSRLLCIKFKYVCNLVIEVIKQCNFKSWIICLLVLFAKSFTPLRKCIF